MRENRITRFTKRFGAALLLLSVSTAAVVVPFLDRDLPTATQLAARDDARPGTGHNHAFCALLGATPSLATPRVESKPPSLPERMVAPVDVAVVSPLASRTRRWHQRAPPHV